MAPFNNGNGGSISGVTTREDWTCAQINFLRIQQGNATKNPKSLKYLSVTANTEGAISGTFSCPVLISSAPDGSIVITATSYLVGVNYLAPTGGDSTAANEVQALMDTVMKQKALELGGTAVNPTSANYLSLSVTMGTTSVPGTNATISIGFSGLPVDMTQAANGAITFEGRTYLT